MPSTSAGGQPKRVKLIHHNLEGVWAEANSQQARGDRTHLRPRSPRGSVDGRASSSGGLQRSGASHRAAAASSSPSTIAPARHSRNSSGAASSAGGAKVHMYTGLALVARPHGTGAPMARAWKPPAPPPRRGAGAPRGGGSPQAGRPCREARPAAPSREPRRMFASSALGGPCGPRALCMQ